MSALALGIQGLSYLVTFFWAIMALRPRQLPLVRDFVVDRCFVLFLRACASSPVGFPPAVGWLLPARPEAVLAGLVCFRLGCMFCYT